MSANPRNALLVAVEMAEHEQEQREPAQPNRPPLIKGREHLPGQQAFIRPGIGSQQQGVSQQQNISRHARPMMPAVHPFQPAQALRQPGFPQHQQQTGE